ncbi:hypothetical protein B9J89_04210 [Vibrio sp. V15_P4S5T153]|nr:hypothetical protein B9J89_04210 [Vibrio sp. V15_P4S5T153]
MNLALLSKIAHDAPVRKDYSSQESFDKASYDYYDEQGSFKTITTVRYLRYSNSLIKAYDNSFEFESGQPSPDQLSLNWLLDDEDPGDFLYD